MEHSRAKDSQARLATGRLAPIQRASRTVVARRGPRWGRPAAALLTLLMALVLSGAVTAQGTIVSTEVGEVPTTGGMRPGPVGAAPEKVRTRGVEPIALTIEAVGIDAQVEVSDIVDGVMQDPRGPFVVSWYQETARPGETDKGNVVMAGHVDYYTVGEAIFWTLKDIGEGDELVVTGADGSTFTYEFEWIESYPVAELTPETIQEIVGPTEEQVLTLITCGGTFDPVSGEYLERTVVRARLVDSA
jgi:LPXTG-site transpeptidase (sortase) family protein